MSIECEQLLFRFSMQSGPQSFGEEMPVALKFPPGNEKVGHAPEYILLVTCKYKLHSMPPLSTYTY